MPAPCCLGVESQVVVVLKRKSFTTFKWRQRRLAKRCEDMQMGMGPEAFVAVQDDKDWKQSQGVSTVCNTTPPHTPSCRLGHAIGISVLTCVDSADSPVFSQEIYAEVLWFVCFNIPRKYTVLYVYSQPWALLFEVWRASMWMYVLITSTSFDHTTRPSS